MTNDVGRAPAGQALAVPAEPVCSVSALSGFDPSRGDFLQHLRSRNSARLGAWEGEAKADPLFHATELGGEVGELLNVAKKLHREAMGWRGSRATESDLADEIGDVMICLDKLAAQYDIDIAAATIRKFNKTSEKVGLPQRLGVFYRCQHCGADERTSRSSHCAPPFCVRPHAFNGNHPADLHAIATEARRAETLKDGSVHEGAGLKGIAQTASSPKASIPNADSRGFTDWKHEPDEFDRDINAYFERNLDDCCTMGVGCDEAGVCYAAAHGEPERCPRDPEDGAWEWLEAYSQRTWSEVPEDCDFSADQMVDAYLAGRAQGIEAQRAETTQIGSVADESPVPQGCAQTQSSTPDNKDKQDG